jgi:hypothetical protein
LGEARRRLFEASKLIRFDFNGPILSISKPDIEGLGGPDKARAKAVRLIIHQLIVAKFKDGMDRQSGRMWAAWQEILLPDDGEENAPDSVEMPRQQLDWLAKIAREEDLKMRPEFAQWREALCDYIVQIESIKPEDVATQ